MADRDTFEGWVAGGPGAVDGTMRWSQFHPKRWEEDDVDIKVTHSGICGSDVQALRSVAGTDGPPIVVGHEVVGVAVRIGARADVDFQVGDTVGVGSQADSCMSRDGACQYCEGGLEQYCPSLVTTFCSTFRNGDKTMGTHARFHRAKAYYTYKIPEGLRPEYAAPMLCAGIAVFSPLEYCQAKGKKVAVVGLGGLGHFAVLFAKALGASTVVGISRRQSKRDQALALGCDDYIATADDPYWTRNQQSSFDLVISTISSAKAPYDEYLQVVAIDGTLVQMGTTEGPLQFTPLRLIQGRKRIMGSCVGSRSDVKRMLQFAVDMNIRPWVQTRPMSEANQAMVDVDKGKARFRYVLVSE